jgi:hypothetical protein
LRGTRPEELAQRRRRVAHQSDIDREAEADPGGVVVDLHSHCLVGLRVVLDVGEAAADDQQRVALLERVLRGARAEEAHAARRPRAIVGQHVLAQERLGDDRAQPLGRRFEGVRRTPRPIPGQDDDPLPAFEDARGALQLRSQGHTHRGLEALPGLAGGRVARHVLLRAFARLRVKLLEVGREGQVRHATP